MDLNRLRFDHDGTYILNGVTVKVKAGEWVKFVDGKAYLGGINIPLEYNDSSPDRPEALVRELAESNPIVYDCLDPPGCRFCALGFNTRGEHLPTCLWLRARKMAGMG
jgi:hypothetical protein